MRDVTEIIVTTDVVLFTILDAKLHVLLHRRPKGPYEGVCALPGGFIRGNEDADAESAATRVLAAKAGLPHFYMEQLATVSGPDRDPRGFSLSVIFLILVPFERLPSDMGPLVELHPVESLPELAFDHAKIIGMALTRLRGKSSYSSLPAMLLPKQFTLGELKSAYEIATGTKINASSFRRKILSLDLISETGKMRGGASLRPAKLWKLKGKMTTFDKTI